MLAIARPLPTSFARAFRSRPDRGLGWYFGAIRTSRRKEIGSAIRSGLRRLERRPTPVFFMPAGALLAGVVEQSLRGALHARLAAIQSGCIGSLNFPGPLAATAGDAQHVALNLGKTSLPHLGSGRIGARVFEYRFPIFGREGRIRSRSGGARRGGFSRQ